MKTATEDMTFVTNCSSYEQAVYFRDRQTWADIVIADPKEADVVGAVPFAKLKKDGHVGVYRTSSRKKKYPPLPTMGHNYMGQIHLSEVDFNKINHSKMSFKKELDEKINFTPFKVDWQDDFIPKFSEMPKEIRQSVNDLVNWITQNTIQSSQHSIPSVVVLMVAAGMADESTIRDNWSEITVDKKPIKTVNQLVTQGTITFRGKTLHVLNFSQFKN